MTTIQSASLNSLSINFFEHPKEDISIKETFLFHFSTLNFISTLLVTGVKSYGICIYHQLENKDLPFTSSTPPISE